MLRRLLNLFRQAVSPAPESIALLNQRQREALRNGDWAEADRIGARIGRSR